ncbi:aldehyde dehydrogenase family protein [Rhodococcus sp. OK302]|uniref:aldehyde dehydrogenase family protein n=1 Tax=Rhodococcus sp. OK302 TaxID=1882769 RepID=UPI0020CFA8D4|nr:aldehyde dehydrogenase family protein [Rhodococcus sp. OK302]
MKTTIERGTDVADAVRIARVAATWWAGLAFNERAQLLDRWRGIIARRAPELAEVIHLEMGKPRPDAMLEIAMALEHLAWASKNAGKVLGRRSVRSSPSTSPGRRRMRARCSVDGRSDRACSRSIRLRAWSTGHSVWSG